MKQILGLNILFGAEGIKTAYEKSLQAKNLDIICLANNYQEIIGGYFEKVYAPRLYKRQTREILPDNKENRDCVKIKNLEKNQVRFFKLVKPSESDLLLFDNQAVLVSYNTVAPFALIISDSNLVASFQNQFETLWSKLTV